MAYKTFDQEYTINPVWLKNHTDNCSAMDKYPDYTILAHKYENNLYLSSEGFSGKPFECPTKYLEKQFIMKGMILKYTHIIRTWYIDGKIFFS